MTLPSNQAKARAVELTGLAEDAGLFLTELALRIVLSHPAVSSVIIGPRTTKQSGLLAAARDGLTDNVLDRIDAIVRPDATSTRLMSTGRHPSFASPPAAGDRTPNAVGGAQPRCHPADGRQ